MNGSFGRPTQVHGVPTEDRAFDSKGNRLWWGLEWHEDHPNARGQKRHPEEKGPFGKSTRRRASSRTRTATPARKENPNLEGFEKAFHYDLTQQAQSQQNTPVSRLHSESNIALQHSVTANKHPTQVTLFGYSSESEWAALDLYERRSLGMICEDYPREPPAGSKKYPATYSSPHPQRPLTKAEKAMAFRYDGGKHWVKVTFDSSEAADRAVDSSPAQIYGHWVYAQPYHGKGPERDESIPVQDEERERQEPFQKSHTMGPTLTQRGQILSQTGTTIPSFAPSAETNANQEHESSPSSSTATSATATGVEYPNLQQRRPAQDQERLSTEQDSQNRQMMQFFPSVPRTVLKPPTEAFLPQKTWWETQIQWLSELGLMPGEIIGSGVPLREDGKPDLIHASFYWRFFYWIDSLLGTDICGLKDDGSSGD